MRFFAGLVVVYALGGSSVALAQDMGTPQDPAAGGATPGDPGMQPAQDPYGQQPQPPPGYGQPPPPAQPMQPPPPPEGAGMPAPPEDVRYIDANVDRYIITSTAETHPEGTFYFTDYELILLQFGYAITDQMQLSLTGVPPLVEDQPYFFDLSLKVNLVRGAFRFAVLGALDILFEESDSFVGGRLGGVGTICFSDACWSHASLSGTAFFNNQIDEFLPLVFGLGVLGRVSDLIAFVGEGIFLAAVGEGAEVADAMIFNYGVRISGRQFGIDVGFLKIIPFEDDFDDPFILGFPIVSFTYRTEGSVANPAPVGGSAQTSEAVRRSVVGF